MDNTSESSDSLEGLSVSAYGTGVMTNDLTNDSQGTYCELGENSQHLESQDLFGSQTSSVSSVLECSNPNLKRQSENDFSIITTASTPLTKRNKDVTKKQDDRNSTSGNRESYCETKKISTADQSDVVETSTSGSQPQPSNNTTILISSASGDHSQLMGLSQLDTQLRLPNTSGSDELNLSQIDTQLKLESNVDELAGEEEHPQLPASLSSSNGMNHTSELHNMSSNSYNSHQIQATNLNVRWENKKVVTKTYSVHAGTISATLKEVRCESTNQVLSVQLMEFSCVQSGNSNNNSSPFVSKSSPSVGVGPGRDSLSSGSVYSMKDGPFPLKGSTHVQRMSNLSSSSELASSAASLAVRQLHRQFQKDASSSHPISCCNCQYEYKSPLPMPMPPIATPDLVSSGPENNSSSVCGEEEMNKSDNQLNFPPPASAPAPRPRKHRQGPPLPLQEDNDKEDSDILVTKPDDKEERAAPSDCSSSKKRTPSKSPSVKERTPAKSPSVKKRTPYNSPSAESASQMTEFPIPTTPPVPILQATRRSSFTKKFVALEQIKEEAKPPPPLPVLKSSAVLTPKSSMKNKKKIGRPPKRKIVKKEIEEEEESDEDESKIQGEGVGKSTGKRGDRTNEETEHQDNDSNKNKLEESSKKTKSRVKRELITNSSKKQQLTASVTNSSKKQQLTASVTNSSKKQQLTASVKKKDKESGGGGEGEKTATPHSVEQHTPCNLPGVMAANVYDPGKLILAIWTDKVYYPAVIHEDLASFLRVKYLDGFVKKIIKQQTIPMSVLVEDTPVHVMTGDDDELRPAKLKAFDEVQQLCTVEWTDNTNETTAEEITSVRFEFLRMFPEHVRAIQNKYTHLLETPKLHQLTLDNVLQRKRTPAPRRNQGTDSEGYSCASSSQSSSKSHPSSGVVTSSHTVSSSTKRSKKSSSSDHPTRSPSSHSDISSRTRPSASVESASNSRKKVLEEKVDNSGNRTGVRARAACSKRIFTEDTKVPQYTKSKTPCKSTTSGGSSSPPVKRRRKSKGSGSNIGGMGMCDVDQGPQPSCSKYNADTENKFRPTYHADIDVTEYCPSSDSEYELHSIEMGGNDIEFVENETDQKQDDTTCSKLETGSNRTWDKLCGPIPGPGHDLFSGYVFVVSHASEEPATLFESDGNLSDQQYAELSTKFPFRRRRLELQLSKGGGTVYPSLNLVPHEKLDNCLLITDRPSTTCNFILALAMRVPVLHYYYVIQCCIKKIHIRKHRLPEMSGGYSLEEKCLQDRNLTSANILGEYFIVVAMSAKRHALVFWEKILKFAGASVKQWHPKYNWDGLASISSNMIVAILVDDDIPEEVLAQPYERILPVWIIQSLIHAQARDFAAHPAYTSIITASNNSRISETY